MVSRLIWFVAAGWAMAVYGCSPQSVGTSPQRKQGPPEGPAWFREATDQWGIAFQHQMGDPTAYELPQILGPGAALWDYDLDGRLDLFLVNYAGKAVLYRQQVGAGRRWRSGSERKAQTRGRFLEVTEQAGLVGGTFGMGVAVGDVDNDGFPELLLTNFSSVRLWKNNGDGTFQDVTQSAGLSSLHGFATAACFCDYDRDGNLDLLVVNYLDYVSGQWCEDSGGAREFCGPGAFEGTVDRLFRNLGDVGQPGPDLSRSASDGLAFEETTIACGLAAKPGKGLGVACGDLTGDGLADFYVANDLEANTFWVQQPDGSFQDMAVVTGTALNQLGEAEAGMGVVAADLDNHGSLELFLTHLSGQTNTLYVPVQEHLYADRTPASGLGPVSLPYTGFGVAAADMDHDGSLDLLIANGRVRRGPVVAGGPTTGFLRHYAEPNLFFINDGSGVFRDSPTEGGAFTRQVEMSRAIAVGDVDNDGDLDFVVTNCGGPARLFLNESPKHGHWLTVRLIGRTADRDAIGADVIVELTDRSVRRRQVPSNGYLSSSDPRLHFGLGKDSQFTKIRVRWPDGVDEEFPGGPADRRLILSQGTGTSVSREQTTQRPGHQSQSS